jgi:secreted PhoX family phosphatase
MQQENFVKQDNPLTQPIHFNEVLEAAMADPTRRQILRGGLGLTALSFLGLAGCAGGGGGTSPANALNFTATPLNATYDGVSVASGYQTQVLYKLGDPINATTPAYLNNGTETAASFDFRAGDHHDGMYFYGLGANGKWDEDVSNRGILCINHEAITPIFLHPNGPTLASGSSTRFKSYLANQRTTATSAEEVQKEFRMHGVSIVEVNKVNGKFEVNLNSSFNRRITTLTPMTINGPLKGHPSQVTKYSTTGNDARGTLNNCASGYTPWGTYLTCEENWANYFKKTVTSDRTANEKASELRYGLSGSNAALGREAWSQVGAGDDYARWNLNRGVSSADTDFRNEANTFGFNVEIDPFSPTSTPRKRTAMGRFNHEGAWVGPVTVGKPVVFYMGCDAEDEYIYKFVSTVNWSASDINGGLTAGDKYLDSGKLYVAKFNSDFTGQWLELTAAVTGTQAVGSETFTFGDLSDPFLNTRLVADKVGATQMDRPEWGAVNPRNGEVYVTLTKSDSNRPVLEVDAANPRSYADKTGTGQGSASAGNPNGHIIRWRENSSNPAALVFEWDIYVFGAETDDIGKASVNLSGLTAENFLSAPDGLWFSHKTGILYIQTDDGAFLSEADGGSTCMLLAAIPGTVGDGNTVDVVNSVSGVTKTVTTKVGKVGELKRLLTGPIDSEITGITESYDGKALFINIQHPGEETGDSSKQPGTSLSSPSSSWPYANSTTPDGNPPAANTPKTNRPRSATIVLTRIDGGVIGTDFTLY